MQLRPLYPEASGRAKIKTLKSLEKHSKHFIATSPFLTMSTCDSCGNMDCSPRGGAPGFVHILDDRHILIPDAKGNNRLDSLQNIVDTGRVGLLFLIPGVDETLRLNGSAEITTEDKYLGLFSNERIPPKCCILVTVEEVFLHCAKALMRSKLWDASAQIKRKDFPTMGKMLNDQLGTNNPEETQAEMVKRYQKDL